MSVFFATQGANPDCTCGDEVCLSCAGRGLYLSTKQATSLLGALGIDSPTLVGETSCYNMAKRARGLRESGSKFLRDKAEELLALCEAAGDLGRITWR